MISTFAGQDSKFGHHTPEHGWAHTKRRLEEITPVCGRDSMCHVVVDPQILLDLVHPIFLHRSQKIPFPPVHGWIFQCASLVFRTSLDSHLKTLCFSVERELADPFE